MEKNLKIFKSASEAEKSEKKYYLNLSPEQRLNIAEQLRKEYQRIRYGSQQRFRRVFHITQQT